jgi:hypothetical protein
MKPSPKLAAGTGSRPQSTHAGRRRHTKRL